MPPRGTTEQNIFACRMGRANGASNGIGASPKSSRPDTTVSRSNCRPVIHLTPGFLLAATALACAVAFISGLTCRIFILQPRVYGLGILDGISITRIVYRSEDVGIGILHVHENDDKNNDDERGNNNTPVSSKLPSPRLHDGKVMPQTRYTSQIFPQDGKGRDAVRSSHDLHIQPPATCLASSGDTTSSTSSDSDSNDTTGQQQQQQQQQCRAPISASSSNNSDKSSSSSPAVDSYDNDDEHLPAGQHLLVDIKNVDSAFLNSAWQ